MRKQASKGGRRWHVGGGGRGGGWGEESSGVAGGRHIICDG